MMGVIIMESTDLVGITLSYHFFFFFNDTATTEIYTLSLHDALPICLGRLLLPARRDRAGGPLVPALRAVVPRRRGVARRTRHPGRSRHHLPLGPAVHAAADRGRPTLSAWRRGPLAGRRD